VRHRVSSSPCRSLVSSVSPVNSIMTSRERDLFPLPRRHLDPDILDGASFLQSSRQRLCRSTFRKVKQRLHNDVWCDEGIQTLNEISGVPFSHAPTVPSNQAQTHAIARIEAMYNRVPAPHGSLSAAGAFTEL
jgi:hypothetical protein